MHRIDPERLDLAREFKRNPVGPHSQDLQKILKILRWDPPEDRFICVQPEPDGAWYLARSHGFKGVPLEVWLDQPLETLAQAQWTVFRARWQQHTDRPLALDADDLPLAPGPGTPSTELVRRPLLGYADRFSVCNRERIEFKVSAQVARYRASIKRIRCGDWANIALKETPVETNAQGEYPGREQAIQAGSYAEIGDPDAFALSTFTLQSLVWPTLPGDREQAILGNWSERTQRGYGLFLDARGALAIRLGDGVRVQEVSTAVPMLAHHWYFVTASVDARNKTLWVSQAPLIRYARDATLAANQSSLEITIAHDAPLRLAAWTASRGTPAPAAHFNGKLEAPRICADAMTEAERARIEQGDEVWCDRAVVANFDFAREIPSDRIVDVSGNERHGQLVNLPTRAMKGARWDGSEYVWSRLPEHYAAIHFHDDDLHDCGWATDFTLEISEDLPSGLYCAHLESDAGEDRIPFVVRPPRGTKTADLALLLPSASYWAYANRHGVIDFEGREQVKGAFASIDATALYLHHHPELGLSTYDKHRDGSGVCYSSRLRPVLSLRPSEQLWQLPADTHITDWLDEQGIAYDVLTEDDLDAEGYAMLEPYRCVMTGTHPEYPSLAMLDAIAAFQGNGGRFVYFGGNGFYWRVSYHSEHPGVMEMRRGEDGIRAWLAEGGEYYHAFTGELGGMWRRMGRAPQSVAGTGMTAQGFDLSTHYERTPESFDPRAAFIFEGVGDIERIGDFGILGGGAAGWEIDRADVSLGTPPHALVVATATDFTATYHWMKEELTHTHDAITGETCPYVHCDMVFYETPNGGAVFSTSSIAWAGALSHNGYENNVSRITRNVLERFLDPAPF